MKGLKITIEATENDCTITVNGVERKYKSTPTGCKGLSKGDWEDDIENGLIDKAYADVVDKLAFLPLDAMYAVTEAEFNYL